MFGSNLSLYVLSRTNIVFAHAHQYVLPKGVLVAVIFSTLITYLMRLDRDGVAILGSIDSSFPTYGHFHIPKLDQDVGLIFLDSSPYPPQLTSAGVISTTAQSGVVIGVLGFIGNALVSRRCAGAME